MKTLFSLDTGICLACSSEQFCATCELTSIQCTSCLSGYTLNKGKCISNQNVGVNMVFNTDYNTFLLNINRFKLDLLEKLGESYQGRPRLITILSILYGSVQIDSLFTTPNEQNPLDLFNTLDTGLEGESFGNLTISSVSVIANGFIPKE